MTTWTSDELTKIGTAEELEIASLRRDGTLRNPRTIWVIRLGDDLYVRSVLGRTSAWFRGIQVRHEGRIQAGGVDKDVTFVGFLVHAGGLRAVCRRDFSRLALYRRWKIDVDNDQGFSFESNRSDIRAEILGVIWHPYCIQSIN